MERFSDKVALIELLAEAKRLAKRYRALTGRPLGVTGEIAEYEAIRLLQLELAPVRTPGYDAIEEKPHGPRRLQIKGRCMLAPGRPGGRLGSIDVTKEWEGVLMVLLDEDFEATAIYDAPREKVCDVLSKPGSRARNERGAMGVAQFKATATLRWERDVPPGQSAGRHDTRR